MARRNPSATIKAPKLKAGKIKVELVKSRDDSCIDVLVNGHYMAMIYAHGSAHLIYQNAPHFNFSAKVSEKGGIEHTNSN